jgi:mannose/cellobiose epimerase-like protein (N-acyl-D-glucosamine 2-epimerase family)
MPIYKVTELYGSSVARRIMTVKARTREEAEDPRNYQILGSYYEIDEGGEAITEMVEELKKAPPDFIEETNAVMHAMEGVLASMRDRKKLDARLANRLIRLSRTNRARLKSQVLAVQA